jgi:hypothetical protein
MAASLSFPLELTYISGSQLVVILHTQGQYLRPFLIIVTERREIAKTSSSKDERCCLTSYNAPPLQ